MANPHTSKVVNNAERVWVPGNAPIIPGMRILPAVNPKKSPANAIIPGNINRPLRRVLTIIQLVLTKLSSVLFKR